MASRVKEDEKNERLIRGLLRLEPNRRCINCNSLGPQYVCTNYWTFVCTNCSGIHREFTHRVKSVSMAKFTSQEVTALQEGGNQQGNSSVDNWASFDVASEAKANPTSNLNPLESELSQLSMPASLPSHASGVQGPNPPSGASVPFPGLATVSSLDNVGHWASSQHQQPTFPTVASQQFPPSVGSAVDSQPSHVPSAVEVKPSGRTELPKDLFTVKHSPFPAPGLGWQTGLPQGMGISMQYYNVMPVPSFSQPSRSTNPFDVSSKQTPDQAPSFPSMSSLHGAVPNIPPSGTMYPSSQGNPSRAWTPTPSSSYASVLPQQAHTHASTLGAGSYMGQQTATNIPMPRQETGNFGTEGDIFGFSNPDQQLTHRPSTTPTSNPYPKGGNPFG
ncbi:hypothetical protein P8452_18600 [Trifolium repens]|nr:hypothetical protein P8452_18600 [Trifolium repens]